MNEFTQMGGIIEEQWTEHFIKLYGDRGEGLDNEEFTMNKLNTEKILQTSGLQNYITPLQHLGKYQWNERIAYYYRQLE